MVTTSVFQLRHRIAKVLVPSEAKRNFGAFGFLQGAERTLQVDGANLLALLSVRPFLQAVGLTVFRPLKMLLHKDECLDGGARLGRVTCPSVCTTLTRRQFARELALQRRDFGLGGPMIAGVSFDLYRPLFTAGKLADLCGVKRPVIDTMATRGFIRASGREPAGTPRRQSATKGTRRRVSKGRPLFSARDAFKVRLMRVLAAQLDLAFPESMVMAAWAERTGEVEQKKIADYEASISQLADALAYRGEWMWAMARSIERGRPFCIYAYATRMKNRWEFDMHVENPGVESPSEPPCFGWSAPNLYVPIGKIFTDIYNDCRELLGLTADEDA